MTEASAISKTSGRAGGLLLLVGMAAYFAGTLGAPRVLVFVGAALIILSIVAFFIEEFGSRS